MEEIHVTQSEADMTASQKVNNQENEKSKAHQCEKCHYKATRKSNLIQHVERVHEKLPMTYRCEKCLYNTTHKPHLKRHPERVHEKLPLEKKFKCKECQHAARSSSDLRSHVSENHENIRPYKCSICSYSASREYMLQRHVCKRIS